MKSRIVFLAAMMFATPASAENLHLVCIGGGSASKATSSSAYGMNNYGDSAWATVTGTRDVGFEDQANVEIVDGVGKIRMPRTMLPLLRGGKDGWFEIENLKIGDQQITGNAGVNFLNSPKIRIDRMTGILNLNGKAGSYTAQCKAFDPATVQRAF